MTVPLQPSSADIYDSKEELDQESVQSLDCVTARRSAILSCPFGQYSSRAPRTGKPVSIPVVPHLQGKRYLFVFQRRTILVLLLFLLQTYY